MPAKCRSVCEATLLRIISDSDLPSSFRVIARQESVNQTIRELGNQRYMCYSIRVSRLIAELGTRVFENVGSLLQLPIKRQSKAEGVTNSTRVSDIGTTIFSRAITTTLHNRKIVHS